jgi:cytochrome c
MTHPTTQSMRVPMVALASVGLVLVALATGGCRDPYAEVRSGLSPVELERFDRGARAAAPCAACHDLAGEAVKIGPHLKGLEGRRAGGLPRFAYSAAMQRSGLVWNARTLDAFLADPQRVVPGNRMISPGVADSSARADLVFFLIRAGGRAPVEARRGSQGPAEAP